MFVVFLCITENVVLKLQGIGVGAVPGSLVSELNVLNCSTLFNCKFIYKIFKLYALWSTQLLLLLLLPAFICYVPFVVTSFFLLSSSTSLHPLLLSLLSCVRVCFLLQELSLGRDLYSKKNIYIYIFILFVTAKVYNVKHMNSFGLYATCNMMPHTQIHLRMSCLAYSMHIAGKGSSSCFRIWNCLLTRYLCVFLSETQ